MAGSLNKVLLIGRLGADPEIKQTQGGKGFASLSVATSENWKDKNSGEKKEKTEWHRVVIFNEGLVNVVKQYLKKGAQIYVEGQLTTNKYTDNNGQEKYSTQIVLQGYNSTLKMLGGATGSPQGGVDQSSASSSLPSDDMSSPADLDDEVPF
ncbi:single-stranded DNA-binding protein [Pelagibacteraceae bacterium]|jgi:single-strand DNA-binding protein|uniref:single-stranded DNA-binding protein n=1 Tax=Pelagibacter sp. (strain IMCC9063) TaxID=1002672 RepID=UPI00014C845D|nr:single-stranded DNA-binding protein [Candidatus Pelagibacter sp. IMCC9063]MDA7735821.1 single-stranded DNA-binding protein [Pelagibacteraceae bacterium]AEA81608.1 single-stranded DNA-binding protein [Candidatus Pelagibacter sp. IMCC9063]MDC0356998.1 single-stranded DNA-binding protein [Pelagibacteraceae bacterium]MDC0425587.1 single-stranded DNA-binding protein [Pelagibacteraceae bacterium]MDC1256861.1 single-stranded DNA-binding protein [Pelagibacteraceae bacterium]|tara:strand:+ start:1643 stop:2098 length:456 start_codon:yes stop_codon:yes gene_type:complete